MDRNTVIFHSNLAPDAVAEALRRSIDIEIVQQSTMPWFIRLIWMGGDRPFRGTVEGNTFRLRRRKARRFAPNFYGKWEADPRGTRVEGHFDLAPPVTLFLPYSVALILALSVTGLVLNLLDLTAGTHFTKDPEVGLVLSVLFVPLTIGFYWLARKRGSRPDKNLLAFLELTLAASRVG